jgi:chemotaxis protein methyltransferase CheR
MTTTRDDYVEFIEGVRGLTDIDLSQYKRGQMERRIRTFAERRGQADLPEYLKVLRGQRDELDEFLDRVTINVSQLWRNPEQWTLLKDKVVRELAAGGRIRAWSAGSSYGAEAYTLAATCRSAAARARLEILGTDIDKRMVARAREGDFSEDDARTAPTHELDRWFDPIAGGWRAKPELREVVSFEVGDLLRLRLRREHYDLILCRNTVIYFTEDVRDALHARLAEALRPGGYLMVGSTERVTNARDLGLEVAHPFTYRKS